MPSIAAAPNQNYHFIAAYNPKSMAFWNNLYGKLWTLIALIEAVAFTFFSVIAITATSLYWEAHLPIVTILIFAGAMPISFQIFKYLWSRSSLCSREAKIDNRLVELSHFDDKELKKRCNALYVNAPQVVKLDHFHAEERLRVVRNLLGRYEYFRKEEALMLEKASEIYDPKHPEKIDIPLGKKSKRIDPRNWSAKEVDFNDPKQVNVFDALQKQRVKRENFLKSAALSRLKAAFILKLIENPWEERTLDDFAASIQVTYPQQLVAERYGDSTSSALIKTPKGKIYTRQEIAKRSIYKLSQEIFEFKGNSLLMRFIG